MLGAAASQSSGSRHGSVGRDRRPNPGNTVAASTVSAGGVCRARFAATVSGENPAPWAVVLRWLGMDRPDPPSTAQ